MAPSSSILVSNGSRKVVDAMGSFSLPISIALPLSMGRSESPRQFTADLWDGDSLVLSGLQVELWTRKSDYWHGQMLFWASDKPQSSRQYNLRTATQSRLILITDITVISGIGAALFEQVNPPG